MWLAAVATLQRRELSQVKLGQQDQAPDHWWCKCYLSLHIWDTSVFRAVGLCIAPAWDSEINCLPPSLQQEVLQTSYIQREGSWMHCWTRTFYSFSLSQIKPEMNLNSKGHKCSIGMYMSKESRLPLQIAKMSWCVRRNLNNGNGHFSNHAFAQSPCEKSHGTTIAAHSGLLVNSAHNVLSSLL